MEREDRDSALRGYCRDEHDTVKASSWRVTPRWQARSPRPTSRKSHRRRGSNPDVTGRQRDDRGLCPSFRPQDQDRSQTISGTAALDLRPRVQNTFSVPRGAWQRFPYVHLATLLNGVQGSRTFVQAIADIDRLKPLSFLRADRWMTWCRWAAGQLASRCRPHNVVIGFSTTLMFHPGWSSQRRTLARTTFSPTPVGGPHRKASCRAAASSPGRLPAAT